MASPRASVASSSTTIGVAASSGNPSAPLAAEDCSPRRRCAVNRANTRWCGWKTSSAPPGPSREPRRRCRRCVPDFLDPEKKDGVPTGIPSTPQESISISRALQSSEMTFTGLGADCGGSWKGRAIVTADARALKTVLSRARLRVRLDDAWGQSPCSMWAGYAAIISAADLHQLLRNKHRHRLSMNRPNMGLRVCPPIFAMAFGHRIDQVDKGEHHFSISGVSCACFGAMSEIESGLRCRGHCQVLQGRKCDAYPINPSRIALSTA
jgi:hypothetical protein